MNRSFPRTTLLALAGILVVGACDGGPGAVPAELTEARAKEIWTSPESQRVWNLQTAFVSRVDAAVARGVPVAELKDAANLAVERGDDSRLADLLFGDRAAAARYVADLQAARAAVQTRFPEIAAARASLDPSSCALKTGKVDAFFDNFTAIRNARLSPEGPRVMVSAAESVEEGGDGPVCGSYKNQILLVACSTGCGLTTAGLGAGLCGWGCWCTFCEQNSGLAETICPDDAPSAQ